MDFVVDLSRVSWNYTGHCEGGLELFVAAVAAVMQISKWSFKNHIMKNEL